MRGSIDSVGLEKECHPRFSGSEALPTGGSMRLHATTLGFRYAVTVASDHDERKSGADDQGVGSSWGCRTKASFAQ